MILATAIFATGCDKFSNKVVFKKDSVYDTMMGSSSQSVQSKYTNNVVYLGDSPQDKKKYGPKDVSFDFYDLRR